MFCSWLLHPLTIPAPPAIPGSNHPARSVRASLASGFNCRCIIGINPVSSIPYILESYGSADRCWNLPTRSICSGIPNLSNACAARYIASLTNGVYSLSSMLPVVLSIVFLVHSPRSLPRCSTVLPRLYEKVSGSGTLEIFPVVGATSTSGASNSTCGPKDPNSVFSCILIKDPSIC